MKISLTRRALMTAMAALVWAAPAVAQDDYPSKPIRIIVPAAPGGGLDVTTRLIVEKMGIFLGQPVIVENRPGAESVIGIRAAQTAEPDGYTVLAHDVQFLLMTHLIKPDAGYDPFEDFRGIGRIIRYPMLIELAADKPETTWAEVVAAATANPDQFSFASGGVGGPSHLSISSLLMQNDVDITHIPYKGIGQALPDVAAGRTYLVADGFNSSRSYIEGGKLRPLAVLGTSRLDALPDVPTLQEQGLDFTYHISLALFAQDDVPDPIVERLSEALHAAVNDPDLQARFASEGSMTIDETPAEFDAFLREDQEQFNQMVVDLDLAP